MAGRSSTDRCTSKRMSRLTPEGAAAAAVDRCTRSVGARTAAVGRNQRRMIDRWGRAGSTFNYDWQVGSNFRQNQRASHASRGQRSNWSRTANFMLLILLYLTHKQAIHTEYGTDDPWFNLIFRGQMGLDLITDVNRTRYCVVVCSSVVALSDAVVGALF